MHKKDAIPAFHLEHISVTSNWFDSAHNSPLVAIQVYMYCFVSIIKYSCILISNNIALKVQQILNLGALTYAGATAALYSSSSSPSSSSMTAAVMLTLAEPTVSGSSQNSGVSLECR